MTTNRRERQALEDQTSQRLFLENQLAVATYIGEARDRLLKEAVQAIAAVHDYATQLRHVVLHKPQITRREIADPLDRIVALCVGTMKPFHTNGKEKTHEQADRRRAGAAGV